MQVEKVYEGSLGGAMQKISEFHEVKMKSECPGETP